MNYTFNISETSTYCQTGTVDVEANSLEEAIEKVKQRNYEHHGDNEIILDTEIAVSVDQIELQNI